MWIVTLSLYTAAALSLAAQVQMNTSCQFELFPKIFHQ